MLSTLRASVVIVAGLGCLASGRPAAAQAQASGAYRVITDHFVLPGGRTIGSTAGITVGIDGKTVWVFERCGANDCAGSTVAPILKFDESGRLVHSFGAGMFVRPHGIHQDREGHIWVTDGEGPDGKDPRRNGKGHQVFKFSPDGGRVLLTLGKAGVAGAGPDTFNMPSAVYVAPNGEIFVADGHGGASNARIVKFTKDGTFIKTWGRKGTGPGEFDGPHALAIDSRGRLFVADRGNNRIQIFDQEGTFLEEWRQFGRPSGMIIDAHDVMYVADHQSDPTVNPGHRKGISIGSVTNGVVTTFMPDPDPDGSQEGIAVDARGHMYGSLTSGMALKKFEKR